MVAGGAKSVTYLEPIPLEAARRGSLGHEVVCVDGYHFLRSGTGTDDELALLVRPRRPVFVNGVPVQGGLPILNHNDVILADDRRLYYSSES